MAKGNSHLEEVLASEEGPHIGALFDFDGTIIAGYSATAMMKEKFKRREISAEELVESVNTMIQYSSGRIGFSGLMSGASRFMKGVSEESYVEFGEELFEKHIAKTIYPESHDLIDAHLAKGHTVAIISSATPYQVMPAARALGIEHVLCSHYEVENGEFTGEIVRPLCFGEGKVLAAKKLAKEQGIKIKKSFFYSDSDDDIELLEYVGKPRPLNPNKRLKEIAEERGWPVQNFTSRGDVTLGGILRSVSATFSMFGTFAASLPILALTKNEREAQNFSTSLFGDISTALAGIELDITGEENLWVKRPGVIIFNHQSQADVMIMAKLVRKDMAGVGKKEIATENPLVGKMMSMSGTVFIDRKNTKSAIEAMEPLIDVMKDEGRSVLIAPEGTRSLTKKIGAFKKGAFHLAMKAGVPIIPVVIHNAMDVSPKGGFIMYPGTVKVDVLPPVDTDGWSAKTMDRHVADVRQMYLDTLGQTDEAPIKPKKKRAAKKKATKPAPVKRAAKKVAAKKKVTKKPLAKKTTARKTTAKKTVAKRAATKAPASKTKARAKKAGPATKPKRKTTGGARAKAKR